jgi:ABC-2 type transport system ATP-binding protein
MPPVIETQQLTKSYGKFRGIVDVDLAVNEGEIFGFLGPNGAGKTTTIRILLDLIRPTSGHAMVFGIESSADPVAIHRRLGYLPGEWNLYDRLTGRETITYFANLRGGPDTKYVDELIQRLDLDPSRRFREYSKGNKQKVGLICALQHRPELLILDEPTSGLDPLVQQTFNELLFEARREGRTVFLSSHIISEVERTCDRVAIIREGRIVRLDTVEGVRSLAAHEVELRFAAPVPAAAFAAIPGVANLVEEGRALRMLVTGPIAPVVRLAGQHELVDFISREPSLEEVFLSEYGSGGSGGGNGSNGHGGASGSNGGNRSTAGSAESATPTEAAR